MGKTGRLSLCSAYIASAVVANLAVARWGADALPFTAFFLVGLDLLARDALHEAWSGRGLWPKMGALVVSGSLVTWVVSPFAERVALASSVSFACAGASNAAVYALLARRSRFARMQASNVVAAVVDSVVFPAIALGVLSVYVSMSQAGAKVGGGLFWTGVYFWTKGSR